jgi:SAM-dependent methyltransferase
VSGAAASEAVGCAAAADDSAETGATAESGATAETGATAQSGATAESRRFRDAYAEHRAREGRGPLASDQLLALPYLGQGPLAREWAVRARSFDALVREVVMPLARRRAGALRVLDMGAGNGWLSARAVRMGHSAIALDVRTDDVDGLGAAAGFAPFLPRMFARVAASFERLPLAARTVDLLVFNASLHYALDLGRVLAEAVRVVRPGGRIAVVDSPFYARAEHGESMAAEKREAAPRVFGDLAPGLQAPRFVEYLTRERLERAGGGLAWRRVRVRYPLWYETRPWLARLRGRRTPSRFDVWWTEVRQDG